MYILVKEGELSTLLPVLKKYKEAKDANKFLTVPFTTLIEYMWLLRGSCMLMDSKYSLLYLAAAVSDFYIPPNEMVNYLFSFKHLLLIEYYAIFVVSIDYLIVNLLFN